MAAVGFRPSEKCWEPSPAPCAYPASRILHPRHSKVTAPVQNAGAFFGPWNLSRATALRECKKRHPPAPRTPAGVEKNPPAGSSPPGLHFHGSATAGLKQTRGSRCSSISTGSLRACEEPAECDVRLQEARGPSASPPPWDGRWWGFLPSSLSSAVPSINAPFGRGASANARVPAFSSKKISGRFTAISTIGATKTRITAMKTMAVRVSRLYPFHVPCCVVLDLWPQCYRSRCENLLKVEFGYRSHWRPGLPWPGGALARFRRLLVLVMWCAPF